MKNYLKIFKINKKNSGVKTPSKWGTILDTNPPFAVLEAYKSLRYNIRFVLSTKNKNSCVISSPNMGDGKSTTIANIAISIAQANERVLLIDMDLRRPTQHKLFKIENKIGVSNIIGDKQNLQKAIHKDIIPGLDILTSGTIPPNPSEMVSSNKAKEIIKWAEENYDYVFIDAPPVNIVSDVLALAEMTAGVVLVARVGATHTDEFKKAIDGIQFVNSELLGVVLNSTDAEAAKKQKMKNGYNYSYSYNYNYNYVQDNEEQ
ncbi:MAG: CpsD/CapB family tyrosine-protein kinase [Eubacterium sp.]|nr:CpsD/CapB family tyrosine-protein kinase [Eubacterium sp.]